MIDKAVKIWALIFFSLGIIISIWFVHNAWAFGYRPWETRLDIAATGEFGDFIGGVVGTIINAAAFYFLYLTLKDQRKATDEQRESFEKNQIESRFFELVRLHRANIEEMVFRDWKTGKEVATGRRVFKEVYSQLKDAIVYTTAIVNVISTHKIIKKGSFIDLFSNDEIVRRELIIGNLAYSVVFFGLSEESIEGLTNALAKDFEESFVKPFSIFFKFVPVKESTYRKSWESFVNDPVFQKSIEDHFIHYKPLLNAGIFGKKDPKYYKYFGGHQSKLGHYYRHLYRTVNYIDSKKIHFDLKEEYIRVLRAQLSNYEEFLFFFNSICFIGREWELNHLTNIHRMWVSKYDLIRNIPYTVYKYNVHNVPYYINFKNFYPLVAFEFEDIPLGTKEFIDKIKLSDPPVKP